MNKDYIVCLYLDLSAVTKNWLMGCKWMCHVQLLRSVLKEKGMCLSSTFPLPSCNKQVTVEIKATISTMRQHAKGGRPARCSPSPWCSWSCFHTSRGLPTYRIICVFKPLSSYIFCVMQLNLILTHHRFKYLYARDPKVALPATIFPDPSI